MAAIEISPTLTAAGQPDAATFAGLSGSSFAGVVNVRPDGEEGGQIDHERAALIAREAGLGYAYVPVRSETITEADIRAFQTEVAAMKGPVYAHCRSGTRVAILHVLGEVLDGRMRAEDIAPFGARLGFDLSAAKAWIDRDRTRTPRVKGFHDARTGSIQYVVWDPATHCCAIIDPVHDFDEKSGATRTTHADAILAFVAEQGLTVEWILDTHPHADHFSAAQYLKQKTGAPMAIGARVTEIQTLWRRLYNWPALETDGSQWDRLFEAGDRFKLGSLAGRVLFSPGHTLASVTYVIGDAAFVHDTIFMPDSGTARADFPGGSAKALWASIQDILALLDDTRLFTGHDYEPNGRHARWESTVGEQKASNGHLVDMTQERFIALREARDATLPMPKLILPSLQINLRGGRLPEPENDGRRYLKIPLNALPGAVW
ncbi:bifunctional sulfur transferase/dioxygenase Blh [Bosea massiliensis]|uniref:Bifunctional sulfur transferase/dioxygenase Blh n=3 Tax=Hyphomicrobiales TaxID=356 RepID=A0ABW0P8E0_9HYPH